MLKNILVPVDGSPVAEAALPYATALARRTGATLTLVRAAHASVHPFSPGEGQAEAIAEAEDYLARTASALAEQGFTVETGVPYGAPSTWIPNEVELRRADLIVMATHDRTGPKRWMQGSVAETVINHATVPVVVVRTGDADDHSPRLEATQPTLVVPLDGSEFAEAVLPVAQQFAAALHARIVLVSVVPDPSRAVTSESAVLVYTEEDAERLQSETRAYLAGVLSKMDARLTVTSVLRIGDAATEIAAEADDSGAAAVMMATHGRSGIARTLLGSVAGGVLHHGTTPVILVRPPQLRASEVGSPAPRLVGAPA